MYIRLITLFLLLIAIFFISFDFSLSKKEESQTLIVEVRGEVEKEGYYELHAGSCFSDLLEETELTSEADIDSISYQQKLYDGQLIVIPKKTEESLISINSATLAQLMSLPGIGEKTAQKIIEYRNVQGCFLTLEELKLINGIGDAKYEKILPYITL